MDLSKINKTGKINENVNFTGQKTAKDEKGSTFLRLTPPPVIELKDDEELGIELVRIETYDDSRGYGWGVRSKKPIRVQTDEEFKRGQKNYFDVDLKDYFLNNADELGYRYVVYKKDNGDLKDKKVLRSYTDTVGTDIESNGMKFTMASPKQGSPITSGPMEHFMLDVIAGTDKVTNPDGTPMTPEQQDMTLGKYRRNHFNKLDGTIKDVTSRLKSFFAPDRLIMSTPITGGGIVASHKYHPANSFAIPNDLGSMQDFIDLQVACFNEGKGYVLDGAYTSEGLEGIHLNETLQFKDSKFKYWFKNPPADGIKKLAVLPDNYDNSTTGIRVVNPKGANGYKYDPERPTYIQFYDTRLTSEEQLNDFGTLIESYDNKTVDDPYEITTHQDAVIPNYFEVDPSIKPFYGRTYGSMEEWDKAGLLNDALSPENAPYELVQKGKSGGFTGWDGNADLHKLNLSNHETSAKDAVQYKEGRNQAREHLVNLARFWTEETRNALIMNVANEIYTQRNTDSKGTNVTSKNALKYLHNLEKKYNLENGTLTGIYNRVLKEKEAYLFEDLTFEKSYENYKIWDDKRSASEFFREEMLNVPFESFDFSPELAGILSTPYITPRPSADGNPAASKNEIYEDAVNNKNTKLSPAMQEVYTQALPSLINSTLHTIQKEQIDDAHDYNSRKRMIIFNGDSVDEYTPFGKYFLEMAMGDMVKFFVTEGLFDEDTYPDYTGGRLDYGAYDRENGGKHLTLKKLGIPPYASEEETADAVAKKLLKGLRNLEENKPEEYEKFKDYLTQKYYTLDPEDYKIAEAVVDRTGAGLNWRFDAAKDVADWDEVRAEKIAPETAMQDIIDVWKPFVREVKKYNPSSYIIGEITSLHDFDKYKSAGDWGKFENADKAEKILIQETGMTANSEYSNYFGGYVNLFGQNVENGGVDSKSYRSITKFLDMTQNFLKPDIKNGVATAEQIEGAHVFVDNHDKPRVAHLMALDAKFFWSNFDKGTNEEFKTRAENILGREYDDNMSSKAAAVAEKYLEYFDKSAKIMNIPDEDIEILNKSIRHIANGCKYKNPEDNEPNFKKAEAFACMPFEYTIADVIDQAEAFGLKMNKNDKRALYNKVRSEMVKPYISKMAPMYEMMTGTTGIPTLFAGDEFAQTGCETKSKNWFLGCRNLLMHSWLKENRKEDVATFNKRLAKTGTLHEKPGMSPLSGGTPLVIPAAVEGKPMSLEEKCRKLSKDDFVKAILGSSNEMGNVKTIFNNIVSSSEENYGAAYDKAAKYLQGAGEKEIEAIIKRIGEIKGFNEGLYNWIDTNVSKYAPADSRTETGAVAKYNSDGEMVVTVMTNAFMPTDGNKVSTLLSPDDKEVKTPKLSSLTLKDSEGRLIAKPGTEFVKKTYSNKYGDYVDDGVYVLTKEGKLMNKNGEDSALDSTVTYFYKSKPFYNARQKTIA